MENQKEAVCIPHFDLATQIFRNVPCAIFIEKRGRFIFANRAATSITGFSEKELLGMGLRQLIHPDFLCSFQVQEPGGGRQFQPCQSIESRLISKNGSKKQVELVKTLLDSDHSGEIMWTVFDISLRKKLTRDKKQLKSQLNQSRKIEALGRLAGGIAHDFNNILGSIMGFTENALDQIEPESHAAASLERVIQASQRARELVKQILSFSRKKDFQLKPVRLGPIVREAIQLVRASLPSTIRIKEEITEEHAVVAADVVQIHQVLMNLCSNAAHAMREKGGILKIELARGAGEEDADHPNLADGDFFRLTVKDSGHGIDDAIRDRIFEPYFTTKEKEEGTGFGLSLVLNIVQRHAGFITVHSHLGVGTTFHTYFPCLDFEEEEEDKRPSADKISGKECILFVEDEKDLLEVARLRLEKFGYRVVTTDDSRTALHLFKQQPGLFDIVITDFTMPHMTGDRLGRKIQAVRPDIPIVICTGYAELISTEEVMAMGFRGLMIKPYSMRELAGQIRKIMDHR